jgi:hypothetical protein
MVIFPQSLQPITGTVYLKSCRYYCNPCRFPYLIHVTYQSTLCNKPRINRFRITGKEDERLRRCTTYTRTEVFYLITHPTSNATNTQYWQYLSDVRVSIGGMILTENNQSNWTITRPSATLSTANTTTLHQGLSQGFSCKRPVINHLSHGTDAQDETTNKYLHQWIRSWDVHSTYELFAPYKIGGSFSGQTTLWSQYSLVKIFL